MKDIIFTKDDIGCWIDGTYGEEHRRAKLCMLLRTIQDAISHPGELQTVTELLAELEAKPSDDFSEEDDAISFLQEYTEEGLYWSSESGGLILTDEVG